MSGGDIDFDVDRLANHLNATLGAGGALEMERTQGGMSNPTYFLRRGDWQAVLRKQPGHLIGQAEFRQPERGMSSIGG